jgi:hypothetical protein
VLARFPEILESCDIGSHYFHTLSRIRKDYRPIIVVVPFFCAVLCSLFLLLLKGRCAAAKCKKLQVDGTPYRRCRPKLRWNKPASAPLIITSSSSSSFFLVADCCFVVPTLWDQQERCISSRRNPFEITFFTSLECNVCIGVTNGHAVGVMSRALLR